MKIRKDGQDFETLGSETEPNFLRRISNTLVRVELQTDMRKLTRRSGSSSRVILKASITSVIVLTIAFIITYSVILASVSSRWPLMRHHDGDKSKGGSRRTKLIYRPFEVFGRKHFGNYLHNVVVKWNVETYNQPFQDKPECSKLSKIVILITSAPNNTERRKAIRETWCDLNNFDITGLPWKCVFLIGQSSHRPLNQKIEDEFYEYHDILQGSYTDSYRNLTIKIVHGLYWASNICSAPYVLKTDDDVYVNTQLLYKFVLKNTPENNVYIGLVQQNKNKLQVIRNSNNKWHVTFDEYSETHYPPYAVGMGYLLSLDVVQNIVNVSKYFIPFSNEDAYIGVLADKLNIEPVRSGRFTLSSYGLHTCNFVYVVVVHHVKSEDQYHLLQRTREAFETCALDEDPDADNYWS